MSWFSLFIGQSTSCQCSIFCRIGDQWVVISSPGLKKEKKATDPGIKLRSNVSGRLTIVKHNNLCSKGKNCKSLQSAFSQIGWKTRPKMFCLSAKCSMLRLDFSSWSSSKILLTATLWDSFFNATYFSLLFQCITWSVCPREQDFLAVDSTDAHGWNSVKLIIWPYQEF